MRPGRWGPACPHRVPHGDGPRSARQIPGGGPLLWLPGARSEPVDAVLLGRLGQHAALDEAVPEQARLDAALIGLDRGLGPPGRQFVGAALPELLLRQLQRLVAAGPAPIAVQPREAFGFAPLVPLIGDLLPPGAAGDA